MKRSGKTTVVSVSLGAETLALLRRRAKKVHDGNLSAAITEAAESLRLEEAREALAADLAKDPGAPSRKEIEKLMAEARGTKKRRRAA